MTTLDGDAVYVLGGLVDERLLHDKTYTAAQRDRIETARLPIPEHAQKVMPPPISLDGESEGGAQTAGVDAGAGAGAPNLPASSSTHTQVLAINQVFDALMSVWNGKGWPAALATVLPPRKGFVVGGAGAGTGDGTAGDPQSPSANAEPK